MAIFCIPAKRSSKFCRFLGCDAAASAASAEAEAAAAAADFDAAFCECRKREGDECLVSLCVLQDDGRQSERSNSVAVGMSTTAIAINVFAIYLNCREWWQVQ